MAKIDSATRFTHEVKLTNCYGREVAGTLHFERSASGHYHWEFEYVSFDGETYQTAGSGRLSTNARRAVVLALRELEYFDEPYQDWLSSGRAEEISPERRAVIDELCANYPG